MTSVIVTGGNGKLGRACVEDLLEHGYEVFVLDTVATASRRCPALQADLTDFGQVLEAFLAVQGRVQAIDAVVHLAAIPGARFRTAAATYTNNAMCSFNVFQAAKHAGIETIVWASSETLLGLPFDQPPPYVPVDEDCASRPETTYALAKLVDETIAGEFCRWNPRLKMIGLRFSNVMEPHDYARFPGFDADPMVRKWNLGGYIDARDGAQAIRKALEHPARGLDTFIIANADTVMSRSNQELMATVFPGVPFKREVGPHETLLSIEKARRVLGYEPRHGWRGELTIRAA